MKSPRLLPICLFALGLGSIGCGPQFRLPNFFHPGNLASQRFDALVHDPYPLDDVGPPVEGGRPLAYQKPVPEVIRAQAFEPNQHQQLVPSR